MKKVLFSLALLVAGSAAFAQLNKGQWLAGGNIEFKTQKQADASDDSRVTSFTLSPDAGYFFMDRLAGGLRVNVETSKAKGAEDGNSEFTVAPFVRYYFLPTTQKVNVLADASYGFGSHKIPSSDNTDSKSIGLNAYQIAAGPAVFLTPNTALEFLLAYSSRGGELYKVNDEVKRWNTISFKIGFQVHLGNAKK